MDNTTSGQITLGFEDIQGGGDNDFNDVVVNFNIRAINADPQPFTLGGHDVPQDQYDVDELWNQDLAGHQVTVTPFSNLGNETLGQFGFEYQGNITRGIGVQGGDNEINGNEGIRVDLGGLALTQVTVGVRSLFEESQPSDGVETAAWKAYLDGNLVGSGTIDAVSGSPDGRAEVNINIDGGFDTVEFFSAEAGSDFHLEYIEGEIPAKIVEDFNNANGGGNNGGDYGPGGNDTISGGAGNDFIGGMGGDDVITGGTGNDTIEGNAGNDWIGGGEGNDSIDGGAGNDTISGGDGDDWIGGGEGSDSIDGGSGDDTIAGGDGDDWIGGGEGNDSINGGSGDDNLSGGDGDDWIGGGEGSDSIDGGAGNDTISGGDGADWIGGGEGNDSIDGGAGNDTISGGDGDDWIGGGEGNDSISGGSGNDNLSGGDGDDTQFGGAGNDIMSGGAGEDLMSGGEGNDTMFGNEGNDTIHGDDGDDYIEGGTGNDLLVGDNNQGKQPTLLENGNYSIFAGSGLIISVDSIISTAGYHNSFGHYFADSNGNPISGVISFANVQETLGEGDAVTITYTAGDIPAGAVQLGFFIIPDGDRENSVTDGDEVTFVQNGAGQWASVLNGNELSGVQGVPAFFSNAALNPDNFDHTVHNDLEGIQIGFEDLVNGGDNDFDDVVVDVTVEGGGQGTGNSNNDTLQGGEGDDTALGGVGDDSISGGSGNDDLHGDSGDDTISGDDGDDWIEGGSGNDIINGGAGEDTIQGNSGDDTIDAGSGDDLVLGGSGNDNISGGDGADTIQGNSGDDLIAGGAGQDILIAGSGNDTVSGGDGNDFVAGNEGDDELSGGAGNDYVVGGDGNDNIEGNEGDDHLYGESGDDTIDGGEGNDVIAGGDGNDLLIGDTIPSAPEPILLENGNYDISLNTNLTISVDSISSEASYNNSFGYYFADSDGNPISGVISFANVKETLGEGDAATTTYAAGDIPAGAVQLGFFIIPDGDRENSVTDGAEVTFVQNGTGQWTPVLNGNELSGVQEVPAFFSNVDLNPDNFDHTVHNDLEGMQISFEDLVNGGDNDFDDVVIDATVEGGDDSGFGQNDTLIGGKGDDTIIGGAGDDVAIFTGNFAEYNITANEDGTFTVEDTVADRDGTDTVETVEFFQFNDGSISTEELLNPGGNGSDGGGTGDPHDNGETGSPHDNGETGNPHDDKGKDNKNGKGNPHDDGETGNPHDDGETGNPHDDGETGNPHDDGETGNPHDDGETGNPHDDGETGNPHDDGETGNPHDDNGYTPTPSNEIIADDTDDWMHAISNDDDFNDSDPENWMQDIEGGSHDHSEDYESIEEGHNTDLDQDIDDDNSNTQYHAPPHT